MQNISKFKFPNQALNISKFRNKFQHPEAKYFEVEVPKSGTEYFKVCYNLFTANKKQRKETSLQLNKKQDI